ncbi:MAG: alanine acetyltransferase, partial [Planctomycetota bacterium]|nr:alanine acetyltransferase [Planctomycetota bacterium]
MKMGPMEFQTDRMRLWVPRSDQAARMVDYYHRNREHLKRWEPVRTDHFYTKEFWSQQLAQNLADATNGLAYRMAIELREGPPARPVLGVLNISNVVRGSFLAAHVGYSIDQQETRNGY